MADAMETQFKFDITKFREFPIILLDVDYTLSFPGDKTLNNNLIKALKDSGNPNLCLFTKMDISTVISTFGTKDFQSLDNTLRFKIIERMGLNIKCVITPEDAEKKLIPGYYYSTVLHNIEKEIYQNKEKDFSYIETLQRKYTTTPKTIQTKSKMFEMTYKYFRSHGYDKFIFIDDEVLQLLSVFLKGIELNANIYIQPSITDVKSKKELPTYVYSFALNIFNKQTDEYRDALDIFDIPTDRFSNNNKAIALSFPLSVNKLYLYSLNKKNLDKFSNNDYSKDLREI